LSLRLPGVLSILFKNFDELLALGMFLFLIYSLRGRVAVSKGNFKIAMLFLLFQLIGILSTYLNGVQILRGEIEDIINCSKFFVVYFGMAFLIRHVNRKSKELLDSVIKVSRILIIIFMSLIVLDFVFPQVFFEKSMKYSNLNPAQLFYFHPAALAHVGITLLALISLSNEKKKDRKYVIMCCLICLSTLTTKTSGFIFIYLCFYLFEDFSKGKRKYMIALLGLMGAFFIGYDSIKMFYLSSSARSLITNNSFTLANQFFPIGSGFGTYGSASAAKYYSPYYFSFGYNHIYGLMETRTSYLTDTFWPIIIAQFGYVSLFLFIGIIIMFLKKIFYLYDTKRNYFLSTFTAFGYLIVMSTSSTSFFNPAAVNYATILAIGLTLDTDKIRNTLRATWRFQCNGKKYFNHNFILNGRRCGKDSN
jgi:hypothetical protein